MSETVSRWPTESASRSPTGDKATLTIALYVWIFVQRATGWHTSLVLAGAFELVVTVVTLAAFSMPMAPRSSQAQGSNGQR
jgi:hypothetical protein